MATRRACTYPRSLLGENGRETGEDLLHDRRGDTLETPTPASTQVEDAWLIAADYSRGPGSRVLQ